MSGDKIKSRKMEKKKIQRKKKDVKMSWFNIVHLKTYFMIMNLVVALVAFSYMINAAYVDDSGNMDYEGSIANNLPVRTAVSGAGAGVAGGEAADAGSKIGSYFSKGFLQDFFVVAAWAGVGALIGELAGGDDGALWGAVSGLSGALVYTVLKSLSCCSGHVFHIGAFEVTPLMLGITTSLIIFALTYKDKFTQTVEFQCMPYEPPIGGGDCEKCNDYEVCSEYTCKSLGQACEIINPGTEVEKCVWANPKDVNSPIIKVLALTTGYTTNPFNSVRPPATGVEIIPSSGGCVKAFTPLEFVVVSDEPAQCKIDYSLLNFEEMNYYVGGDNFFDYNHTEKMSLPGPDSINAIAPELQNDGIYTLYLRCQDANGNINENPYAVRFCVEKGPDTEPPIIMGTSIPSGNPIGYNQTGLGLEVYINEPAECKWSREDKDYDLMEHSMNCAKNIWEMNSDYAYTCKTNLTGIEDRKENDYYFRCKDQPGEDEDKRNVNTQSYPYTVIGTQPLNIIDFEPKEGDIIYGATDTIPVFLKIKTDNGFRNGEATCYYSLTENENSYIEFLDTGENEHEQRQDLPTGDYEYFFKCVDLGGNSDYASTSFRVETDRNGPAVVRVYKESVDLKIITNEMAECSYSFANCNFEIDDGIAMETIDYVNHKSDWKNNQKYYIRCKDSYENQPVPNKCSIIVKPYKVQEAQ